MENKKLIKLIRIFFALFILGGIGSIIDYYFTAYPQVFAKPISMYDIIHINQVHVAIPGVPLLLIILTITIFVFIIRKFYRSIINEIKKDCSRI